MTVALQPRVVGIAACIPSSTPETHMNPSVLPRPVWKQIGVVSKTMPLPFADIQSLVVMFVGDVKQGSCR